MRAGNPMARASLGIALGMGLVHYARNAHAQAPPVEGAAEPAKVAAEALFDEGKRLMTAGEIARACAKLGESERLDPAAGTLLNLADCYEKNGQLASAWVTFREAATASERSGRPAWAEQAGARARLLEPRLPTVTIQVDAAHAPEGIEIARDGVRVARSTWGSAMPVDPSEVHIEARAPNKKVWTTSVRIDAEHPHVVVTVPLLDDVPARRSFQKPIAVAMLGGAAVSIGLASYFGVKAITRNDEAANLCPASPCTNPDAVTRTQNAKGAATASTVSFVVGGVLAVAGVWLFVTAPSSTAKAAVRPEITIGRGVVEASIVGRF